MDRDTIIRLAREAGVKPLLYDGKWAVENLDVFAALVAEREREECIDIVAMHGGSIEIEAAIRSRT